jgi:regulator of protease activity HflC (stomatin/prohibitin superfamily)
MKRTVMLAALALSLFSVGCSTVSPNAGEEAVLITKPIIFGHGGVLDTPVSTGLEFVALTTDHVMVSKQPIQVQEHFDDLMSSDGVPLDFDAVIRVQITDSVKLIKQFGLEWYKNNVGTEFRNRVRQAVRKHGMNETAINTSAIEEIDKEISSAMEEYIKAAGLPLQLIQITVGKANPPDSIKNQRVETAAQQQRVLTEQQRKLAEDSRKAAEQSRAEADNTYRNQMQLSPDQFLQLERIKMQQAVCAKGGCVFINGNATPIVDVRK